MSSNKHKDEPIYASHKKTARKFAFQYLALIIMLFFFLIALTLIPFNMIEPFRMDAPEMYRTYITVFKFVFLPCELIFAIVFCCYATYRFMLRPLKCLEQLAQSAKQLAVQPETPIALPEDMTEIENDLNEIRESVVKSRNAEKAAAQEKDDLLIYLAHDLKTPLSSILGYTKLIEDEPTMPAESISRYAGIARAKAQRLEEFLGEFFEITRFSTSKLSLEATKTNLSRMLMQITNEFTPILAEKNLTWDLEIPEGIELICDIDKMERAIDNLVRNAVLYSYENTPVQFALSQTDHDIEISIANAGKTIPKEKLTRIFEQFYRMDSSRSGETGGAGLGLAITKKIVELHHGTITAYSENETIRFVISIPKEYHKNV